MVLGFGGGVEMGLGWCFVGLIRYSDLCAGRGLTLGIRGWHLEVQVDLEVEIESEVEIWLVGLGKG